MTRKELIEKGEGLLSVLDGDSPPIKLMLDGECLVFLVRCAVEQMKSAPDGGGKVRLYYDVPASSGGYVGPDGLPLALSQDAGARALADQDDLPQWPQAPGAEAAR